MSGVISIPPCMPMVCLINYILCADVGVFEKIEIKQDRLSPIETVGEALEKKLRSNINQRQGTALLKA
jgi:hypothetical protein